MGGEQALTAIAATGDAPKERLELIDLAAGGLDAASHAHRYELAAALCGGRRVLDLCCGTGYGARILAGEAQAVHGVDLSEQAIATARELDGDARAPVTFEQGDALAHLRAVPPGRFDAIVCFEGLEHVPDPQALVGELVRLADNGTRVVVSLPNSRAFDEQNEFHVTDFGHHEMRAVAARFDGAVVLSQYLAEASLIEPLDAAPGFAVRGRLVEAGVSEPPAEVWANHWLILVGVDAAETEQVQAGLALGVARYHNDYMRQLERANAELRRANARMARDRLGVHDAAAASAEARRLSLESKVRELRSQVELLLREKAVLQAPRYRAVDAIRTLAFTIPGVGSLLRLRSRLIQRRERKP